MDLGADRDEISGLDAVGGRHIHQDMEHVRFGLLLRFVGLDRAGANELVDILGRLVGQRQVDAAQVRGCADVIALLLQYPFGKKSPQQELGIRR